MEILIIGVFVIVIPILVYLRWRIGSNRNFDSLFNTKLTRHELQLIKSEYPGIFKVGPFKKFEINIGKPQINNGAIQYERTYYRKLQVVTKDNKQVEIWAKIETGWFKDTTVDFKPKLNEIK